MPICGDCRTEIRPNDVSYVSTDPITGIQQLFHGACGDPLGFKSTNKRIVDLERVAACLLDHYLGCYDGNKDSLALEAEKLIPNWQTLMEEWRPK